jgi:hypothetical protein
MNILGRLQRALRIHQRPKVFCIGYNKTGTTTLERVLTTLGYRMPSQATQETLVVEELFRGNYKPLYALCRKYDAFQDLPFSQDVTYAVVDALFPGSKFILTVRDSNAWFESLARFHLQGVLKKAAVDRPEDFGELTFKDKAIYLKKNYLHNVVRRHAVSVVDHEIRLDWSLVYNKAHRIDLYERRNQEIVKHFQGRQGQLLVLDVSKEKDNSRIVEFLGLPKERIDALPHLNRS